MQESTGCSPVTRGDPRLTPIHLAGETRGVAHVLPVHLWEGEQVEVGKGGGGGGVA